MNCLKFRSLLHCALMLVPAIGLAGLGDIQLRIDEQVKAGGGRVTISAGTWVTGPIRLASNIELHLEKDAVLEFPDSPELYWDEASATMRPLVGALCSTNVSVTGSGTLVARADYWHGEAIRCKVEKIPRPRFIQFQDCRDVRLEGFRVRNSPSWTVHMLCSDNVVIRGLDMRSCGYNNDGIDLESVQGAVVEDCYIDAGDDAICMKSGKNKVGRLRARPTKDVLVRNCTVVNGHTLLGIGSELSGGIENIRLESCKVLGEVWRVLRIKTNYERGGYARNITVKGVAAARAKCAIFEITNGYSRWRNREKKYHTEIENVTVEDVVCDEAWMAYELVGDPEMPAKNITVRNCELKYASRGDSIAKNIEGLVVENVRSKADGFSVWCDDPDSLYECGEKAVFNVHSSLTNGIAHVRLDNFGSKVLREFDVDLSKTRDFTVEGGRDIPGFLLLTVTCGKTVKRWGAAFSPAKISGGAPRPADFVKFWYDAVRDYDRKVREDVKLERVDSLSTNGCSVYLLSLSDPKERKVYGFLKEPDGMASAPYPVKVAIPGAGPSSGTPAWKGGRKNIELMMNVHYYRPVPGEAKRGKVHNALQKEEDEYYNGLYPVAKNPRYTLSGIASSREDYFYYGAILAINRAVNWLRRRPNVNPDEFTYSGGSQGGGMGLALVAINGKFKKAMFGVPALTAHLCHLIDGREAGWPRLVESQKPENQSAAIRNAPYFDGANFASMITCPVAFSVGYTDTVAPPHAGYAAFNACPSRDKAMFGSVGFGHKISPVDSARMRIWLDNCDQGMKMLRD